MSRSPIRGWEGLRRDLARIARWFEKEFDRAGVRGVAVFAAGDGELFRTLELPEPVADDVRVEPELHLAPLARFAERDGALVAVVGRERGQVYRLDANALVPIADESSDTPRRHDQGGLSQANYERHIETIVDRHLRDVAATLERCVRRTGGREVVLVGTEETRPSSRRCCRTR